ncbi:MAG: 30S ribosomal protein S4 [Parcubacteria group bacterium]|jgi:small subunit ribosomal protein S4
MPRDFTAKCKRCRRAGEKLFLKGDRCATPKCAIVKRPYPPGVHKSISRKGLSEFGQQLATKQKVKRIYGVMEKQLKIYFQKVKGKSGVTGDLLMQRLEMRLDNVIYRCQIASSRCQARQLVKHSHFTVNGKIVDLPSYIVKKDDVIEIKDSKLKKTFFKNLAEVVRSKKDQVLPSWLQMDADKLSVKVTAKPTKDSLNLSVNPQMIVEFYSR